LAEEIRADNGRERPVEVEIIPFEYGTEGGGKDDLPFLPRHGPRLSRAARC
jgi:hypothetical protein